MFALAARAADKYTIAGILRARIKYIITYRRVYKMFYDQRHLSHSRNLPNCQGWPCDAAQLAAAAFSQFYIRRPSDMKVNEVWKYYGVYYSEQQPAARIGRTDNSAGVCKFDLFMGISQCASAAPSSFYIHDARSACHAYSERVFSEPLIFMNRVTLDGLHTHTHLPACVYQPSQHRTSHITFPYWKMMNKNDQRNEMHFLYNIRYGFTDFEVIRI